MNILNLEFATLLRFRALGRTTAMLGPKWGLNFNCVLPIVLNIMYIDPISLLALAIRINVYSEKLNMLGYCIPGTLTVRREGMTHSISKISLEI